MEGMQTDESGIMKRKERPSGTKKAKTEREKAAKGTEKSKVEEGIICVASCMEKIRQSIEQKNAMRGSVESRRIGLESERFWGEKAEKMFGAGSSAPLEERNIAESLIRKRVLSSLQKMSDV